MSGDAIEVVGTVVDEKGSGFYGVAVGAPLSREVLCRLSGKLTKHRIRVLPGDGVTVELSAYDMTRGRITFRGVRRDGAA